MLRTKSGLPKYCSYNEDQRGKRFVRFRKNGFACYLTGTPWGEEFMRTYAAALEGVKAKTSDIGSSRTIAGSVNALVVSYYRAPEFRSLKFTTQAVRRNIIENFRKSHGNKPVALLKRVHLKEIIGAKSATPHAANNLLKVLRLLLGYAISIDMIDSNPALAVGKFKGLGGEGRHTWSEKEILQFEARHPIGTRPRLAMALMLYTASRKGDVVKLGWQQIRGDSIVLRQEKTDEPQILQIHPALAKVLAATPRTHLNFLTTERGAPFTSAGFGNWFRDRCDEAGLPQCSAHGLRKACATRLADIGCSNQQIKAVTGHKSDASLAPYIKQRDQQRLARQAMQMQVDDSSNAVRQTLIEENDQNANKQMSSNQIPLDKVTSK